MADEIEGVQPNLIRRTCGGWLAVSPSSADFSVGVTAPTEGRGPGKIPFHVFPLVRNNS
jgi:hypothetical protein